MAGVNGCFLGKTVIFDPLITHYYDPKGPPDRRTLHFDHAQGPISACYDKDATIDRITAARVGTAPGKKREKEEYRTVIVV